MEPQYFLAASYAQLGKIDDAEWVITELGMEHPEITLSHIQDTMVVSDKELERRLIEDLRAAGMAE